MKYSQLESLIQGMETKWQKWLQARFPANPDPCMLNGQMQFFVVGGGSKITKDDDLPVVVTIGSNYGQEDKSYPWLTPHLGRGLGG